MALAVTHVILTIVLLDLFRHYLFGKHKFPRYLLVIGGLAGLLPDIDIPFSWLYSFFAGTSVNFHGTFTHSLLFPILFLIIAVVLPYQKNLHQKNLSYAKIFYVISAGWFFHLLLDCTFGGYKALFWPWLPAFFCPQWGLDQYAIHIDAIILIAWLIHEELHQKIKDYI